MTKYLKRALCILILFCLLINLNAFYGYYRFHQCAQKELFVKVKYDYFQTDKLTDSIEIKPHDELYSLLAELQYRGFSRNWPAISPEDKAAALFLYAENGLVVLMIQNDSCWIVEENYRVLLNNPSKLYQYIIDME